MNKPGATVFVVDDDADLRRALVRLLRSASYDTRAYASSSEFLAAHDPDLAGCVILDLALPGMNGLEVQASLTQSDCTRPVIFLSGNGSIAATVKAMRAGAVTFLTKPVDNRDLFSAIDEGLRLDAEERQRGSCRHAVLERLATLTPRERQVLTHVVAGRLNKQIAADLGTVLKTIKVHRARVMQKMGARSLAQLVRLAALVGISGAAPEQPTTPRSSPYDELVSRQNVRPKVSETPRSLFSSPSGGSLL